MNKKQTITQQSLVLNLDVGETSSFQTIQTNHLWRKSAEACGLCVAASSETKDWVLIYDEIPKNYFPPLAGRCCRATNVAVNSNLLRCSVLNECAFFGERGAGGDGEGHRIEHKIFPHWRSAWTHVVHLRNPNRRRLNLEHNNSRISQVYAARAPSRLAALIHNIHHRGNWWAKSRPNDFLRRQSERQAGLGGLVYFLWRLVIYSCRALARSPLIPTCDPVVARNLLLHSQHGRSAPALCVKWARRRGATCHPHKKQPAVNKNTPPPTHPHHPPPPEKNNKNPNQKNPVAPLMKATDAKPLVSLWSCLRSAEILLPLVPPFLICTKGENNLFLLYK